MAEEVFDLDAVVAEAEQTPFRFKFGGEEFTMSPLDLKMGLKELTTVELFQAILGEEQWARIVASPARLTEPAFVALLDRWTKHYGMAPGESPASPRSSVSTGGPSKRTSKRTTAVR